MGGGATPDGRLGDGKVNSGGRHPETSSWPEGLEVPVEGGEGLVGGLGQTKVGPGGPLGAAQHN
jgi:hypothetical protein